jgi:glycopeptide antibiotics resistance protein
MRLIILYILLITGVLLTLYLSWIPQPDLSKLWYMPVWLGRWSNAHDTLRTAVPFIYLGLFSGALLYLKKRPFRWWFYSWLGFVALVSIAEFGQVFLPHRVFDWRDIVWGTLGAIIGLVTAFLISICVKTLQTSLLRENNKKGIT